MKYISKQQILFQFYLFTWKLQMMTAVNPTRIAIIFINFNINYKLLNIISKHLILCEI